MSGRNSPVPVVVRRPMNDYGTMTVEVRETNETRHLCEYATAALRRTLGGLPVGTTVPLAMSRVGVRANVWRAIEIVDGGQATTTAVEARVRQER